MDAFGNGAYPAYRAPVRPENGLPAPVPAAMLVGICWDIG